MGGRELYGDIERRYSIVVALKEEGQATIFVEIEIWYCPPINYHQSC